nr:integrase, catalytic region, zinc finger, CCHC-type, peptidase aspartic, catalytic [Tanacetum cinerariifolium]
MLDKKDFDSWQQRIRLYCLGKDNGENILKSIDEGPFQMGTFQETLGDTNEGALHIGPVLPRVFLDLTQEEKDRYKADIRAPNILLQGLLKDIYTLINHYTDAKDIWDNVKMLLEGSKLTKDDHESQLYDDFEHFKQNKELTYLKQTINFEPPQTPVTKPPCKMVGSRSEYSGDTDSESEEPCSGHIERNCTQPKRPQNSNYYKDKMLLLQAQENGAVLDEEQLLFITGEHANTFNEDVNEAPVLDMAHNEYNIFQADQYTISEVQAHGNTIDNANEHHEEHEMHHNVQQNYVVHSNAVYTGNSNIIPYEQHLLDNEVHIAQSDVSSVPNDASHLIINSMNEPTVLCAPANEQTYAVNASLAAELAIYKEQVEAY